MRNWFANLTFRVQLIITVAVGITVIAIASTLSVSFESSRAVYTKLIGEGKRIATTFASSSALALLYGSEEQAQDAIATISAYSDVRAMTIFDRTASVLAYSGAYALDPVDGALNLNGARVVKETQSAWHIAAPVLSRPDHSIYAHERGSFEERHEPLTLGYVVVVIAKDSARETVRDIIRSNIITTSIVSGILLVFLICLANSVSKPISRLSSGMKALSANKKIRLLAAKGAVDIASMAHSFNDLAQTLESRNRAIEEGQRQLEEMVARRTRQLELANKELQHASEAKSRFLSNMSHELRTPLSSVVILSDLLINSDDREKCHDYARRIQHSAQMLNDLVRDILDFAKIEAERIEIDNIPFDLHDVMARVRSVIETQAQKKGLEMRMAIYPDTPTQLIGDPTRTTQVLLNLANNAVKFTDQGYVAITVSPVELSANNVCLHFEIEDTGIGIDSQSYGHIWDAFQQGSPDTSRQYGGTGLGTTIARRLTELMNGKLGFSSIAGQGTKFWVDITYPLQAAFESPARLTAKDVKQVDEKVHGKGKVLIAEDNEALKYLLNEVLRSAGYDIVVVSDGKRALAEMKNGQFDVAIIDMHMPVMDGEAAIKEYRQWDPTSNLSIIVLTADATGQAERQSLDAGANLCLTKPIMPSQLIAIVASMINK